MNRNNDLTKVIKKAHENKWVALTPNREKVIDYSDNLLTLRDKIGDREATYIKVRSSGVKFAF